MILVHIPWVANPFRGDKFAEGWAPAAEMVLDFGALSWGFYRAVDGRLDFIQEAIFPSKAHFERYWYSESLAEKRIELQGYYNVPVLPEFYEVVGEGRALTLAPGEPS
ncbi:MAG: hypothetical protein QOD13_1110 [Thermoleophilaceae bacterium]|nr:hypothetical protein [Thermoleophilaceae bacterium]